MGRGQLRPLIKCLAITKERKKERKEGGREKEGKKEKLVT